MDFQLGAVKYEFRPASRPDLSSLAWGVITSPRVSSIRWQDRKGTLDDQSIFGPVKDYHCFCGMCARKELEGIVCTKCWTIIEASEVRKSKFGIIFLEDSIPHPFEECPTDLWVIPVLPAAFRERLRTLDSLYDDILRSRNDSDKVRYGFRQIITVIWPLFLASTDPETRIILARGIALMPRHEGPFKVLEMWKGRICSKCHERDPFAAKHLGA
jgi:hypothetical protein